MSDTKTIFCDNCHEACGEIYPDKINGVISGIICDKCLKKPWSRSKEKLK